jgi:predicted MFS family arabinose efflux permease
MAGFCTFLAGLFCLVIWIFAKSYGVLIFFAIITGTVSGTFWATVAPVGAEVVGIQVVPSALSICWVILVLPCTFAEPIALELRTTSVNIYRHAQLFTGFMYIGAAICMWFLRVWKINDIEKKAQAKEKREQEIQANNTELKGKSDLSRHASRTASVKSKVKAAKGLWSWQRV